MTFSGGEGPGPPYTLIRGTGVGAYCSALLLNRGGVRVSLEEADRPRVPAIMIGSATQTLIEDVFGRQDLFGGLHRIDQRVVAWGPEAEPKMLPHSAIVISERQLADRLRPPVGNARSTAPDWTIFASRPLPPETVEHRFGSRSAKATLVQLADQTDSATCWIESLDNGWLFLIPNSPREGWLLTVGDAPLEASRVIVPQIASAKGVGAVAAFMACPRMVNPICDAGWLACGTAAMAFDPICGDGTGNAVREAILAAAVVRAPGPVEDRLAHYRMRLLSGFLRHLDQCRQFYATGGTSDWWRAEHLEILRGMNWCQTQLDTEGQYRYQLRGFDLERIAVRE